MPSLTILFLPNIYICIRAIEGSRRGKDTSSIRSANDVGGIDAGVNANEGSERPPRPDEPPDEPLTSCANEKT